MRGGDAGGGVGGLTRRVRDGGRRWEVAKPVVAMITMGVVVDSVAERMGVGDDVDGGGD